MIQFKHVRIAASSVQVCFSTTKTRGADQPPLLFSLPALARSPSCPVYAWPVYTADCWLDPEGPALVLTDASLLSKVLSLAASAAVPTSPPLTLHSLRCGVAQACLKAGVLVPDIQEAGSWTSSAMNAYFTQIRSPGHRQHLRICWVKC